MAKKKENKSTRLVYVDKNNIETYESLEPNEFKEFFMKYFTYKYGDKVEKSDFSNPLLYALFNQYKSKIDANEEKWFEKSKQATDAANKRWSKNDSNKGNFVGIVSPNDKF